MRRCSVEVVEEGTYTCKASCRVVVVESGRLGGECKEDEGEEEGVGGGGEGAEGGGVGGGEGGEEGVGGGMGGPEVEAMRTCKAS